MKKQLRKILAGVLAVATLFLASPISNISTSPLALKSNFTASAETLGNLVYKISNDTITITKCSTSATEIVIPSEIDGLPVTRIAYDAFNGCEELTSITVDGDSEYFSDINGVLFNKDQTTLIQYPVGRTLDKYEVPDSVTGFGYMAFSGCTSLTEVTIPNSVTSLGGSLFWGCYSLTSMIIPDSVTSIESSAFAGCLGLTEVIIPSSVTMIKKNTFYGCKGLTSITIPDSVTSIEHAAFYECSGLTEIIIPNSVDIIGEHAFRNCSNLTEITIPESVTSIENYAFYECPNLTEVTFLGSESFFDNSAFNTDYLRTIYGYTGSTAETYANENGITFIALDGEFAIGDLNADGVLDSADIVILKQAIFGRQKLFPNQAIAGDVNGDGKIDVFDLALLKRNILN